MTRLTLDTLPEPLRQAAVRRSLTPDQILFQQHEPAEFVFFLETGQIRLVTFTDSQIIHYFFVEPGESFAELTPFNEAYSYTAIADRASEVLAIPKAAFIEVLHQDFALCKSFMTQLGYRFDRVRQLLLLRSIRSARERLLRYLIMNRSEEQPVVELVRPLKDLASELGLVQEVLSRTLTSLQNEGIIQRDRRQILLNEEWLLNPDTLLN